jgi:hypothetical protein
LGITSIGVFHFDVSSMLTHFLGDQKRLNDKENQCFVGAYFGVKVLVWLHARMGGVGVFHPSVKMTITSYDDHYFGLFPTMPKYITK